MQICDENYTPIGETPCKQQLHLLQYGANSDANEQSSEPLQRLIKNIVSNVVTGNESWHMLPRGSSVFGQVPNIQLGQVPCQSVEVTGNCLVNP